MTVKVTHKDERKDGGRLVFSLQSDIQEAHKGFFAEFDAFEKGGEIHFDDLEWGNENTKCTDEANELVRAKVWVEFHREDILQAFNVPIDKNQNIESCLDYMLAEALLPYSHMNINPDDKEESIYACIKWLKLALKEKELFHVGQILENKWPCFVDYSLLQDFDALKKQYLDK